MNTYHESWKPLFNKFNISIDDIYSGSEVVYPEKEYLFRVFEMDVREIKLLLLLRTSTWIKFFSSRRRKNSSIIA